MVKNTGTKPSATPVLTVEDARRKSRFGPYGYICFPTKNGASFIERVTPVNVRKTLLEIGTSGKFVVYYSGVGHIYGWRSGLTMLRNSRAGVMP